MTLPAINSGSHAGGLVSVTESIDLAEAESFLSELSDDTEFTFQTFDDNESLRRGWLARILHGPFSRVSTDLQRLNQAGAGIFVCVNRTDLKGRLESNVTAVRALFVDLDGSPVDPVLDCVAEPSIVVESSPGRWHAYWRVSDCPLDRFRPLQKALALRFGGDPAVIDLPRVMRLPGPLHCKATPFRSRIVQMSGAGDYSTDQLVRALDLDVIDAPQANGHARPAGEVEDWYSALLAGTNLHDSALHVVGRMVAKGLEDAAIRAWFAGMEPKIVAARGADRASLLLGDELSRMIDGARGKGYDQPSTIIDSTPDVDSPGWREPVDLFREVVPPRYAFEDVPAPIADLAVAATTSQGFDQSGIILAAVAAAAAAIDDRFRLLVRPSSGWFESCRLWIVLIGGPSAGKSPTIRTASNPLKDLHRELFAKWLHAGAEESGDPRPAVFTSDATVEALADVLKDNPRGIVMLTEEFASWIGSLDAYRDGGGAKSRGEWLQLYDGGPHQINRVKRGSFLVPNWGASVIAACTPAGLRDQVRKLPDDGLIHRFMPAIMRTPTDELGASLQEAEGLWSRQLREIFARTTTSEFRAALRFSVQAQSVFDAEVKSLRRVVDVMMDLSPALASHVGKHSGMLARVCAVFHVVSGRPGDAIEPDTVALAIRFMRRVRQHSAALFTSILSTAPSVDLARAIARSIAASESGTAAINRSWLTHHCKAFRTADDQARRQAVQHLEDCEWIAPDPSSTRGYGGWAASNWLVNPGVADRFAATGRAHRERRAAIRAALEQAE